MSREGFWGPVDVTIDWCEYNYAVTPYIAEFWNCLSSFPMTIVGIIGYLYTRKLATPEQRFSIAYLFLALVGLGSAAFHGTLRHYAQFMDEMPMLWADHVFLFMVIECEKKRKYPWLSYVLMFSCVTMNIVYLALYWYSLFLIFYGSIVLYLFGVSFYVASREETSIISKRLAIFCVVSYSFGFILWCLEHAFCKYVQYFYLHSFWHLFAGAGTYMFILFQVSMRARHFQKEPELTCVTVINVPVMAFVDKKSAKKSDREAVVTVTEKDSKQQ
eukprot:TRINITY_DN5221_c0_g1_i1.p1 TRINITY_DN5221_c0_g1~~TRINITY_DN5221_c0_g1_i1.p1  ORF type:complete len:273 (+),score=28.00 TRINITY_DN5221_c0_g1_i1:32-850(+)